MPVPPQFQFPGVFVEETPPARRAIAGVETAVTAFVGRALRGPLDEPVLLTGMADFERRFGGLWLDSALGYAVRDFFDNGGRKALVVRVYRDDSAGPPAHAELVLPGPSGDLLLQAKYPGAWGNELEVSVAAVASDAARRSVAERHGLSAAQASLLFDLNVADAATGATESFTNLTIEAVSGLHVAEVLAASELVAVTHAPAAPPSITAAPIAVSTVAGDGRALNGADVLGDESSQTGMRALGKADIFNLLCIPPYAQHDVEPAVWSAAAAYCEQQRAMLLVDPPAAWTVADARDYRRRLGVSGANAALYFPSVRKANPLRANALEPFPPTPSVAGVIARTDAARGVWKAPAGRNATLLAIDSLALALDDTQNGSLNRVGVNGLRTFPGSGPVVWGARTIDGDERLQSEWKYLPVRRTALFIEESVNRGTAWAVFEANDATLWAALRSAVETFMQALFRQGAFQGASALQAYFVRCDGTTVTRSDIESGVVNMTVGFAPLKPAEFVVLRIRHRVAS